MGAFGGYARALYSPVRNAKGSCRRATRTRPAPPPRSRPPQPAAFAAASGGRSESELEPLVAALLRVHAGLHAEMMQAAAAGPRLRGGGGGGIRADEADGSGERGRGVRFAAEAFASHGRAMAALQRYVAKSGAAAAMAAAATVAVAAAPKAMGVPGVPGFHRMPGGSTTAAATALPAPPASTKRTTKARDAETDLALKEAQAAAVGPPLRQRPAQATATAVAAAAAHPPQLLPRRSKRPRTDAHVYDE